MRLPANIVEALEHSAFFKPMFAGQSWNNWRTVLRGAFALPMSESEREFFRSVTGREPPSNRVKELDIIAGRRSGKDSVASALACFAAVMFQSAGKVRPGERPVVMLIAADKAQSRALLGYVRGYFTEIPRLKAMVQRDIADGLELSNGVDIMVVTCDFRTLRGRTVLLAIFNEVAFWSSENSANPDVEVHRAVLPAMATLGDQAMLVMISSAYRRSGLLYDRWAKFHGKNDPNTLVVHAATADLNPSISKSVIENALADDPEAAKAEWLSLWRDDLASYLTRAELEAIVDKGISVRLPISGVRYSAFVDASSGAGKDSFCCAVGHRGEADTCIIDSVIEIRPPFNLPDAVAQIAATLRSYGITTVTADRWGLGFVEAEFTRHGIALTYSERTSSEIFRQCLPVIKSGRARLVDNERVVAQFSNLERRILPAGGERIGHPERGGHHDDCAVVVAGCLMTLSEPLTGAAGWIEFYRRQAERAWDGDIPAAGTEFDDVRPGAEHGWSFHSQAEWKTLVVPCGAIANEGRIYVGAHSAMRTFQRQCGQTTVDVLRREVSELLSRPAWRDANEELARELGLGKVQ
ncbi:hypothetical protein [Bradyrhizobium sp. HKCCYLS3013]|uniref:hypothetical protein n=1 Tax=Bradyrhizobium sp. HKCCYLS3013 TaxID=3420735 RepID=UPI003EBC11C1